MRNFVRRAVACTAIVPAMFACTPPGRGRDRTSAIGFAYGADTNVFRAEYGGIRIALDELNERARDAHRRFELRLAVLPNVENAYLSVATSLRDDPSVVGAVGFSETLSTIGAADIVADIEDDGRKALTLVSPTATGTRISGLSPWVFRLGATDSVNADLVASFAADSLRVRRIAIVYPATLYGKDWLRSLQRRFRPRRVAIVDALPYSNWHPFDTSATLWRTMARDIASRRPDAIIMPGNRFWYELRVELRRQGCDPAFIVGDYLSSVREDPRFAGMFAPAATVRDTSDAGWQFLRRYRRRFESNPPPAAWLAHDAASLIGEAVLEVGTNRRAIRDWIASLGRERPPNIGATGALRFDALNSAIDPPVTIIRAGR